jgi:hypothetical protein
MTRKRIWFALLLLILRILCDLLFHHAYDCAQGISDWSVERVIEQVS